MGYPPSGAVLAKISKNSHAHLIPGGLLGAKLAALGPKMAPLTAKLAGLGNQNRANMAKIIDPKMDNFLMPLGVDFCRILIVFWYQNEGKLVPKLDHKSMLTSKGDFLKIKLWLQRELDFSGSGGSSWEPKSIKNRLKHAIQDGMHLDIDFLTILIDFGTQLGMPNPPKSV